MTVRLYAMTCGWLTVPYGWMAPGETGELAFPVLSYLIDHPAGLVLYDTGLERELQGTTREEQGRIFGELASHMTVRFLPGEDIASRLEEFGCDPARITYLISSHLHFDHCGGNRLIPNARWLIQKREWETASDVPEERRLFDLGHDRIAIDGRHDVFGDGTVLCVPTYGHTPGHQSLEVTIGRRKVVLTADACYLRQSLEKMLLPDASNYCNPSDMIGNYKMFEALRQSGAVLIFGHDPIQANILTGGPIREVTDAMLAQM